VNSFILFLTSLFIFIDSSTLAAENILGSVVKIIGNKIKIDGVRAQNNTPIKVGTVITSAKGNNRVEILLDQMRLSLTAGQLSFNKDMTKSGKKKGRHLKVTLDQGILCINAPNTPKDANIRIKSGPHEIYLNEPENKISYKFCIERENGSTLLYWPSGRGMFQKIKPTKISFAIPTNSSQQWRDSAKQPENFELSLPKKQRFMDLLDITETIQM
jgi:hypothetical protein